MQKDKICFGVKWKERELPTPTSAIPSNEIERSRGGGAEVRTLLLSVSINAVEQTSSED